MSVKLEQITEPVLIGEGPHWDEKQQALFFVSVHDKTIHKYVLATGEHTRTNVGGNVACVIPVEGTTDQFLIATGRTFKVVRWDGKEGSRATLVKLIGEIDKDMPKNNINDAKADPRGRVFGGTRGSEKGPGEFALEEGSLFRLDGDKITKVANKISMSNGLAWDLKEKAFYYVDTLEYKIRKYDYDVETGEISNMKYIFDFKKNNIEGGPDGATIDTDGNLWVAAMLGSSVLKIDPRTGELLQKVTLPVSQVTSVTFGGPNYDILFVTTGKLTIGGSEPEPPAGATYMVTGLGVKGNPNISFKL